MATFTLSQKLLTAGASLCSSTLLLMLSGNVVTSDAGATAADASSSFVGADFPICHTPTATGVPNTLLRLVQTEVPSREMSVATSAPAFADTEPPLWDGLGSIAYKITTVNDRAQAYFDQGLRFTYAFNHGEAQRAFRMAQKLILAAPCSSGARR